MLTLLLITIYVSFISLGLPDSLLGSAWPAISTGLGVSISAAGILSMITAGGTIVSSINSAKIIRRFGTGRVTAVSVAMTALALLGNSIAPSFIWLCLFAVQLGLGAGAVDSALNNFVALHYESKHMNWLHCFWGVGATAGPIIMAVFLVSKNGWRSGYLVISVIQICLVILLIFTLPLWKKMEHNQTNEETREKPRKISELLKVKIAKPALLSLFCYCSIETTVGLWGSSFLVNSRGLPAEKAAGWISLFYFGITLGRFISGFIAMKIPNKIMIRSGIGLCLAGALTLLLPLPVFFSLVGFILIGLGCAPIFPSMLHETPNRFGKELSQSAMGIQMACAYLGTTLMPPILGLMAGKIGFSLFPVFLLVFIALVILTSEMINKEMLKRRIE
jgi:fucose permease